MNAVIEYQNIYTELMAHRIPFLKNKLRQQKMSQLSTLKSVVMVSGIGFFAFYNRMGIINRLLLALVSCNLIIFVTKGRYYSRLIEDAATEMSLIGQETRI